MYGIGTTAGAGGGSRNLIRVLPSILASTMEVSVKIRMLQDRTRVVSRARSMVRLSDIVGNQGL